MSLGSRKVSLVGLVLAVLIGLTLAQLASALHPRPKGATPLRVSLVPTYKQCTSPNRTHGPPLAFPSCTPPVQTSDHLTVGTPDANGAAANSVGFYRLSVVGDPGTPSSADVVIQIGISDVRCKPTTSAAVCTSANAADGPDYSGELQANATIRITDHNNSVSPGGGPDAATVTDIPFPANVPCATTSSGTVGGTCSIDTSMQAVQPAIPGSTANKRAVIELTQVQVADGGADGNVATTPNTLFATQGVFIP